MDAPITGMHAQAGRQAGRHAQAGTRTHRQIDRREHRQTDRQAHSQTDRQSDRQTPITARTKKTKKKEEPRRRGKIVGARAAVAGCAS